MKTAILIFLIIPLSVLVLFTSTETITFFSGSHNIVNISTGGNDISCAACHSHIINELSNSSIHSDFKCEECHRIAKTSSGKVIKYALHNESGIFVGNQSHSAYTPRCLDCHGGSGIYYNDTWVAKQAPPASAFNESDYGSDYSAHKPFVQFAGSSGASVGENEACLACHTNYSADVEFKRHEWFTFAIQDYFDNLIVTRGSSGQINISSVHKASTGAKHEFLRISDIKCESCHMDIWQAANQSNESGNNYHSTNASHVCWQFAGDGVIADSPMHNATCVHSEYGATCYGIISGSYQSTPDYYDNITEYCTLSCHRPIIGGSTNWNYVADTFKVTVHAARKVSCYDCHERSIEPFVWYFRKPANDYIYCSSDHYSTDIMSEPLFIHAETCIACKRNDLEDLKVKAWTEPNTTMYNLAGNYI